MKITFAFFYVDGLLGLPFWVTSVFVAAFGAIIGSFLNVVIHRLPREESIVFPNSRCPSCEALIGPFDNIPLISYAILRGRCRKCRAPISWRYPAVELLTAIVYAIVFLCDVYWRGGMTFTIIFDLIFVSALIALIFIDAEHMLLPNAITYPGIAFAIIARLALPYLVRAALSMAFVVCLARGRSLGRSRRRRNPLARRLAVGTPSRRGSYGTG